MTKITKLPPEPTFDYQAALYFLDGQYLFKTSSNHNGSSVSKFVTAADLASAFSGQEQDTGWLPPGVVRCGNDARGPWFVYSAPPQKVIITVEGQKIPWTIPIPRTVLVAHGRDYYLWAMASKAFESGEPACHAPFPNVYDSGRICWGSNSAPKIDAQAARKAWQKFFDTPFSGQLANGKSRRCRENVLDVLKDLHETNAHKYPLDDLVQCAKRIADRVNQELRAV